MGEWLPPLWCWEDVCVSGLRTTCSTCARGSVPAFGFSLFCARPCPWTLTGDALIHFLHWSFPPSVLLSPHLTPSPRPPRLNLTGAALHSKKRSEASLLLFHHHHLTTLQTHSLWTIFCSLEERGHECCRYLWFLLPRRTSYIIVSLTNILKVASVQLAWSTQDYFYSMGTF